MFQARHYTMIAKVIALLHADAMDRGDMFLLAAVDTLADRLLTTFARDNPRFKPARFMAACGLDTSSPKPFPKGRV